MGRRLEESVVAADFNRHVHHIHEVVKKRLTNFYNTTAQKADQGRKNREFEVGDMVLIHVRKKCFPGHKVGKLPNRQTGLVQVTRKLGSNAYEVKLPNFLNISPIFNIGDLIPCEGMEQSNFSAVEEKKPANKNEFQVPQIIFSDHE